MKKTVCVLFGGRSQEHEVSRQSAASIVRSIDKTKYSVVCVGIDRDGSWHRQPALSFSSDPARGEMLDLARNKEPIALVPGQGLVHGGKKLTVDIVFPALHGPFGEDGTLQGLLEMLDLPYAGAGVLGSAIAMDKEKAKSLWQAAGLPVAEYLAIFKSEYSSDGAARERILGSIRDLFTGPVFVKPACAGSSVGVTKVTEESGLRPALERAFQFDTKVLVERAVRAREIECAVIGNDRVRSFPPGEIVPRRDFYSYEAKYLDPDGAALVVPADLPAARAAEASVLAARAYRAVACEGFARVDLFLDQDSDAFLLNEINSIPGFTNISMFPRLCAAGGLTYADLIDEIIKLGLERFARRSVLNYHF